jgi:hypothetical protein
MESYFSQITCKFKILNKANLLHVILEKLCRLFMWSPKLPNTKLSGVATSCYVRLERFVSRCFSICPQFIFTQVNIITPRNTITSRIDANSIEKSRARITPAAWEPPPLKRYFQAIHPTQQSGLPRPRFLRPLKIGRDGHFATQTGAGFDHCRLSLTWDVN